MRKNVIIVFLVFCFAGAATAQNKLSQDRLTATRTYMQQHLWNATTGNFVRRADQPNAPSSDAWGISIVLDADAYMVAAGAMKPQEMKQYFASSSMLYDKTDGISGARILGRQSDQIYIGGDDDMQWCAALVHCFEVTKDSDYLNAAKSDFNSLVAMGFWQNGTSKGWSWNSSDRRPNGVSTAYGALAAARLYASTGEDVYKQWANSSLVALNTPQVGFFPRDMMVAANAALTVYDVSKEKSFLGRANDLESQSEKGALAMLHHDGTGERNPTDIGDLADGLLHFYKVTHKAKYKTLAETFINFFVGKRTTQDISEHGFFSRYDTQGAPIQTGAYLGVPCTIPFLPEVAEMEKLFAIDN